MTMNPKFKPSRSQQVRRALNEPRLTLGHLLGFILGMVAGAIAQIIGS